MTTVTVSNSSGIDLERFMIYFGSKNGEKIYEKYLQYLTNRQVGVALGYKEGKKAGVYVSEMVKEGKFRASRLKSMCSALGINPLELRRGYKNTVEKFRGGSMLEKVDEKTKESVWSAVCDKL